MINRQQKEEIMNEMVEVWKSAKSIVFYNFNKMNASDMENFRKTIRKNGLKAYVCKNTLIEKSAHKAGIDLSNMEKELLIGQTGIVICTDDPFIGPKTLDQIAKEKRKIVIKGGFFDGRFVSTKDVKDLANVPSRDVLNQQLAYTLLAPVTMFATTLHNTVSKLVYVLDDLRRSKETQN